MRWAAIGLVLWVSGGAFTEAWAQKKRVADFEPKNTDASDQGRKKGRLGGYAADQEAPEPPFPWAMVGLVALIGLLGAPVAYIAWRNSAKELEQTAKAYAPTAPRKRRREEPDDQG